jgi:hypothetical protein
VVICLVASVLRQDIHEGNWYVNAPQILSNIAQRSGAESNRMRTYSLLVTFRRWYSKIRY